MKRIAVFGVGHLGKIHCKCIQESKNAELIGIYDPDGVQTHEISEVLGIPLFDTPEELLALCDVADIVTTTSSHYEMAKKAIEFKRDTFIEKPVTVTVEQAEELMILAEQQKVKVQVGHVERFNPAFIAAQPFIHHPMFIETHRLAMFNPRGNDVSVVLDLMIHDLDIVLKVVPSRLIDIQASGVAIVTDTFDIANVRLRFENGCVANLTASRLSLKNMRKTRLFQSNAYISINLLEKKAEIIHLEKVKEDEENPFALILDTGKENERKQIIIESPEIMNHNAIQCEIESFVEAIENNTTPVVSLYDGCYALKTAYRILDKMNEN
ncbi:MAG: Gfo/Idh/MocA family oxidoreductase, partial [Bacteroidales bacterium]